MQKSRYKVRYRLSSASTWTDEPLKASSARTHTVTGLSNDSEYTFEVLAVGSALGTQAGKEGEPASITATPMSGLAGPAAVEFPEVFDNASDWESFVGRYEKSGSYDWTLAGLDSSQFELTGTSGGFRQLHFLNPPDHESPTDAPEGDDTEGDNVYKVTVQARPSGPSGAASGSRFMLPVTVEVTDEDDPGKVTVAPTIARGEGPPRVGEEWTATVTDDDGSTVSSWAWSHFSEFIDDLPESISGATESTYTPEVEDIGQRLIASASYTDGFDPNNIKPAKESPPTGAVVANVPSAPGNLQVTPGHGEVTLDWVTAADNGSALTRYDYRQSTDGGTTWDPDWKEIPLPDNTAAADLEEHTVERLTDGQEYTFEVRAVNAIGDGAASQVSLPAAPGNFGARWVLEGADAFGHHEAKLSWTDPSDPNISWEYRKKEGTSDWETAWTTVSDEDPTGVSVVQTVDGLDITQPYRFQVRVRQPAGWPAEAGLSPLPVFTQPLSVKARSGAGKAQFDLVFSPPVDGPDLPDDAQQVSSANLRYQLVTISATGVTTTSDFVDLAHFSLLLPAGASLVSTFSATDLAPVEGLAGGASETQAAAFRQAATLRITGLDPGVTYQIKMRLVASDGATISESTSGLVLGLRWQRPTAGSVELTWTDPDDPVIRGWQYRQQAGSGSWGLWQSVPNSTASTTSHTVSSLDAEETYRFQVGAIGPGGLVAESFTVSAAPKPLVAPGTLRADPGHASMTLRWDDANNARITGWQYRQRQAGEDWGAWQPVPNSTASTTSYTVTGLTNGVSYRFRVRALAGSREGPFGKSVGGPPNGLRAQALNGAVELVWADPSDSRIAGWQYRVRERQDSWGSWSGWQPIPGSTASTTSYTVPDLTNGVSYRFRVRGVASNGRVVLAWPMVETSPDASLGVPPAVPGTNGPPEITSGPSAVSFAENGAGVVATYAGTDPDNDALIWTLGGADADTMRLDASGRLFFRAPPPDFESPGDANGDKIYEMTVSLSDGRPDAAADTTVSVRVRVTDVNEAPVVSGVSDTTFAEKGSGVVVTYAATDPEGTPITWTLGGADADTMRLDASGRLRFRAPPPDFEDPGDANVDTVYEVTVTAGDGSLSSPPFPVRVRLTNIDEPGRVILPASPQEGLAFTAALTDPDGDVSAEHEEGNPDDGNRDGWVFERRRPAAGESWQLIAAPGGASGAVSTLPELKSYTPTAADVGHLLRARVSYRDGHGPNKNAQSEPTGPVTARPPPPPEAPVVSGVSDTTFAEKGAGVVATYTATAPEGTPITWLLGGADADTMRLDASGRLRFRAPPDYESPGDANVDTVYEVTVTAGDGSLSSPPFPVRVRLTNVDEPGRVILPASPQEGLAFTATLTDPDGDVSARHEEGNPDDGDGDGWVFERRRPAAGESWQLIAAPGGASGAVSLLPELKSYTPTAADVGRSEPRTSRYTRRCDICCACGLGASEST